MFVKPAIVRGIAVVFAMILASGFLVRQPAHAAESYDNCVGTISTLPATISTQGVWCLKSNLSTNIGNGAAITIAANNVTIDCNGFRLSKPAVTADTTEGIFAGGRRNITVRHCNVQGFRIGIHMSGATSGGDLIEENTLAGNTYIGMAVNGDNNLIRRNRVVDTGGAADGGGYTFGIDAKADVLDNVVRNVFPTVWNDANLHPVGVRMQGDGSLARGNTITMSADGVSQYGVIVTGNQVAVNDNALFLRFQSGGVGIQGKAADNTFCHGNLLYGFATANCQTGATP